MPPGMNLARKEYQGQGQTQPWPTLQGRGLGLP